MGWIAWTIWIVGGIFCLGVVAVMLGATYARAWSGERVGEMRVRKWFALGVHDRMRLAVRRSLRGPQRLRNVHLVVGGQVHVLNQVEAVKAATLLEKAFDVADGKPVGRIRDWEVQVVHDDDFGRCVALYITVQSDGPDLHFHAVMQPGESAQLAQWLREAAAPGETIEQARRSLQA